MKYRIFLVIRCKQRDKSLLLCALASNLRVNIIWLSKSRANAATVFQKYWYLPMGCTACNYFPTKISPKHLYGTGYAHNRPVLVSQEAHRSQHSWSRPLEYKSSRKARHQLLLLLQHFCVISLVPANLLLLKKHSNVEKMNLPS